MNFGKSFWMPAFLLFCGHLALQASDQVRIVHADKQSGVPDAEVDSSGVIHVAYVAGENAFYRQSADGGKTFSTPIQINSEPGTVHPSNSYRGPDLALGKNGRVHVIWYVNAYQRKLPQDHWGVFYAHIDPGQNSFSPARNLNHKPSDNYSLAANAKGEVDVVWMAGKLFLTSSNDNGDTFSSAQSIDIADPCECCASRALLEGDKLIIAYREKANNVRDMHLLTREPGKPFSKQRLSSTEWQINSCPMTGTSLTLSKDSIASAWETKGEIFFTTLNSTALAPTETKATRRGKWPVALRSADGSQFVSWKDGNTVNWQIYDQNGSPLSLIRSETSSNPNRHAAVALKDGSFLIID